MLFMKIWVQALLGDIHIQAWSPWSESEFLGRRSELPEPLSPSASPPLPALSPGPLGTFLLELLDAVIEV